MAGSVVLALLAADAPPAIPQTPALSVTQQVSSRLVEPGTPITITITVAATGARPVDDVEVDTISRRPEALDGLNDPHTSVTTTQGACAIVPGFTPPTNELSCKLGTIQPGTSVTITTSVTMTQAADLFVLAGVGVETNDIVNVDGPPVITGSRRAKLAGIPKGCVPGDFRLTITAPASPKATSVEAYASLPESPNDSSDLTLWKATARGTRLRTVVPASKIVITQTNSSGDRVKFDQAYQLHVIVHRRHAAALKTTIAFKLCTQPLRGIDI